MNGIHINRAALVHGGTLACIPGYRSARSELRLAVRIEADRRRYDVREWFEDEFGEWRPGRHGISGMAGAELRKILRLLEAAAVVIPKRGSKRVRAANGGVR